MKILERQETTITYASYDADGKLKHTKTTVTNTYIMAVTPEDILDGCLDAIRENRFDRVFSNLKPNVGFDYNHLPVDGKIAIQLPSIKSKVWEKYHNYKGIVITERNHSKCFGDYIDFTYNNENFTVYIQNKGAWLFAHDRPSRRMGESYDAFQK